MRLYKNRGRQTQTKDMNKFAVFLRGINVAGKGLLKMKDFQQSLTVKGLQQVQTYIQSGNIILTTDMKGEEISSFLEKILKEEFSLEPAVFVLSVDELDQTWSNCPFAASLEQNKVFVLFANSLCKNDHIELLKKYARDEEEIEIVNGRLYIYYPNGMGKSKLTTALIERKLGVQMTARNLNTLRKMVDLANV